MIGDGEYVGFHVDVCHRIIANLESNVGKKIEIKYQSVTSQNRIGRAPCGRRHPPDESGDR